MTPHPFDEPDGRPDGAQIFPMTPGFDDNGGIVPSFDPRIHVDPKTLSPSRQKRLEIVHAAGLVLLCGESLSKTARQFGVSRQAVSKCVKTLAKKLGYEWALFTSDHRERLRRAQLARSSALEIELRNRRMAEAEKKKTAGTPTKTIPADKTAEAAHPS